MAGNKCMKKMKLSNNRKKYAIGGYLTNEERTDGSGPSANMRSAGRLGQAIGSGYYAQQLSQAQNSGDRTYASTMGAVSQAGPMGGIIGGITAIGDSIGKPIKQKAERQDEITGAYTNQGAAYRGNVAGGMLNPYKTLTSVTSDPAASKKDKALAYANMAVPGLFSVFGAKGFTKRKDAYNQQQKMISDTQRSDMISQNYRENYDQMTPDYLPTFAYGGKVKKYPDGGETKVPIKREYSYMQEQKDELLKHGIDSPYIYDKIEQNPGLYSSYFSMLKDYDKEQATPYSQRFLINYNNRFARGDEYLDPNAASLRTVRGKKWQYTDPNVVDTLGTFKPYIPVIKPEKKVRYIDSGAQGVYANGGYTNTNSELESGEPFRTPDGNIQQVPNNAPTHAEGGVKMNLPNNTEILGKMIDPVNDEEFKVLGQKLKKAQDKYNKVLESSPTPLAKKTAKMMLDKVQGKYDELMSRQESMKQSSNQQPTFAYGGLTGSSEFDWKQDPRFTAPPTRTYTIDPNTQLASTDNVTIPPQERRDSKWNIGESIGNVAEYAPIAYNLYQGLFNKPQTLKSSDFYNPYRNTISNLMRKRSYNVDPELEANKYATANYYRAMREASPTQARYLSGLQSGQISRQRADADAYARKQNIDNQYRAEEAQTLANLGQQQASTDLSIEDINARRKAAQRQYIPTALSQIQQASFTNKQMKQQKLRDKQRIKLAKEMYKNYPFDLTKIFEE